KRVVHHVSLCSQGRHRSPTGVDAISYCYMSCLCVHVDVCVHVCVRVCVCMCVGSDKCVTWPDCAGGGRLQIRWLVTDKGATPHIGLIEHPSHLQVLPPPLGRFYS